MNTSIFKFTFVVGKLGSIDNIFGLTSTIKTPCNLGLVFDEKSNVENYGLCFSQIELSINKKQQTTKTTNYINTDHGDPLCVQSDILTDNVATYASLTRNSSCKSEYNYRYIYFSTDNNDTSTDSTDGVVCIDEDLYYTANVDEWNDNPDSPIFDEFDYSKNYVEDVLADIAMGLVRISIVIFGITAIIVLVGGYFNYHFSPGAPMSILQIGICGSIEYLCRYGEALLMLNGDDFDYQCLCWINSIFVICIGCINAVYIPYSHKIFFS